jgi:hypothetical protein
MLTAFLPNFTQSLINAETPGKTSNAEAAAEFSRAFALFFQNASILGTLPVPPGGALLPSALGALQGILASSFAAIDAASSSSLMQAAFLAYLNAGVTTWWAGVATGVVVVVPLNTFIVSALAIPDPLQSSAKAKLAAGICTWLTTGLLVNLTPSGTSNFS